jgi:hypothetical protein
MTDAKWHVNTIAAAVSVAFAPWDHVLNPAF